MNNLRHYTDSKSQQLLSDRTRRADLDVADFSEAHAQLGTYLGLMLVEDLDVESYEIHHCQGVRTGVRLSGEPSIGILCMMRAGLYLCVGLRRVFRSAQLHMVSPGRRIGLNERELSDIAMAKLGTAVIVDSVVNSGESMRPVLAQLRQLNIPRIFVVVGVAHRSNAESIAGAFPDVTFHFGRLSENSYVGKGATDTGNRLFGTPDRK